MTTFPSAVSPPGSMSYAAPLLPFTQFANWAADDPYQRVFNQQQQQLNTQRLTQGQRALDASSAISTGDFRTKDGGIDYGKLVQTMLRFGDVNGLQQLAPLMIQQQAAQTPMVPPADGSAPPGAAPGGAPAPRPAPGPAAPVRSVPGGDAAGSIISRVTDALPPNSDKIGIVAGNIAKSLGVDPNAALTPEQAATADRRITAYAQRNGATAQASPATRVDAAFAALPPSASAGTPAPPAPQAAQPAPIGAPGVAPGTTGPAVPMPINPFTNQPITSPQQAQNVIATINGRIAQLSANPHNKVKIETLENVRTQIQESIKPLTVNPNTTLVNPADRSIVYQGPAAAAIDASARAESSPTLDADAERYLQSGTLPPNLSKNLMGQAEAKAIRDRAAAMATERGINTAELPQKWQQFKAQQVAIQRFTSGPQGNTIRSFNVLVDHLDTLGEAVAALNNGNTRVFNNLMQTWSANTGGTAPTNFDGVKALVGDEIVKAVVGSAGALADREEVKKDLNRSSSPAQLNELIGNYKKLALGQLHGLQKQYETATGLKNFDSMLLPGTLKQLGGDKKGEGGKGEAKPDKDGWISLPNGARIQEVK